MKYYRLFLASQMLLVVLAAACDDAERVLQVEASGHITGVAYTDWDGDGRLSTSDRPVAGVRLSLVDGGSTTVSSATTGADGIALFRDMPIGSYRVTVDAAVLSDSLVVSAGDTLFRLAPDDSIQIVVRLEHPLVRIEDIGPQPSGRRVMTYGVALHAANLFGDSTLHLADGLEAVRITNVSSATAVVAGDSVRVIGRIVQVSGQPVVRSEALIREGRGTVPTARRVSSAAAATAQGGGLDASLVEISTASVVAVTQLPGGDQQLTADDGSGPVHIVLDAETRITVDQPLVPGAVVTVVGVVMPGADGTGWVVKPRGSSDLRVTVPTIGISEARRMENGRLVAVEGVALSGWATFGDATVHVRDRTGAVRVTSVSSPFLFTGDSIRVVGIMAVRDGQPSITSLSTLVLGKSSAPSAVLLRTGEAAHAARGALDAALVEVHAEVVSDTTVADEFHLTLDDGSGPLTVVLDRDAGVSAAGYPRKSVIRVTGVLVPRGAGRPWVLKPRGQADLQ